MNRSNHLENISNKPPLVEVIYKANQVIMSCLNQDHINGARKYVNQVFKIYSSPVKSIRPYPIYSLNPNIFSIYKDLMDKVEDKELELRLIEYSGKV